MAKGKQKMIKQKILIVLVFILGLMLVKFFLIKKQPPLNSTNTVGQTQITDLDISVCDPTSGPFSSNIDNPFFSYPEGKVSILESESSKVQITSLNKIEVVAGVETRVIEEREWSDGNLKEISLNYFTQASDGTICYFGEIVDIYENGQITSHEGSWRAGEGQNKPGIMMPAIPVAGQSYQQEIAPGVAFDRAEHLSLGETFTTPAGKFENVLLVKETPDSTKRYAEGIGLIFDDGDVLTFTDLRSFQF
ncbi:hypothetical protein A2767_07470 [Candidatus Roizmanbacteria bacterium RIFCSPHIGHO2_01_FULL_35_10]|uniref:Uncharacterized protein n=1 Tax=Candidatus Roizmanbacteria bacterium RIFCSPLOWO2_01_FULL_35_13 TaxID=1802055 RepID=A0A1F7IB20_9BACT|nr:MAG: hypothetical protein A2767_07470 [Candidatus Roizmanbacteria bacterium RIFCSPHIGHO2_01_FULL_35_10]OGK40557.1 MAG: hypothetical protein A3A74_00315 [Candidatus Roizmanbacteria bacterium RIFCSPLOWO2_01_FULL_35_13]